MVFVQSELHFVCYCYICLLLLLVYLCVACYSVCLPIHYVVHGSPNLIQWLCTHFIADTFRLILLSDFCNKQVSC